MARTVPIVVSSATCITFVFWVTRSMVVQLSTFVSLQIPSVGEGEAAGHDK